MIGADTTFLVQLELIELPAHKAAHDLLQRAAILWTSGRHPELTARTQEGDGPPNSDAVGDTIPLLCAKTVPAVAMPTVRVRMAIERTTIMSVTLDFDEQALATLPFGPGERERHMQIELACRFYASGWLTLAMGVRLANLDHYAFGVALAERGIPRQYGLTEAQEDLAHARRQ